MIHLRAITKTYTTPAGPFPALDTVDLDVRGGELVAVCGRSGSGKSTLLNLIAGIDTATSGDLVVAGTSITGMSEHQLSRWRGATVGIVFQFFQLMPALTVLENVILPMDFRKSRPAPQRRARALELLARVGVADQAAKLPASLSGGQQQRVAIARALANDPPIVTADEPTGNLDSESATIVLDLFRSLAAAGTTVMVATHDREVARLADRTLALEDGRVQAAIAV